ncbi:YgiW/YdeI family stress tolerance OB fold protein [Photobacterium nomapromontoriensis]|uniref:YgiW/YdeI family stress tolerance OB fold protein n=1 Tax=Photobacterium nomapromontoriensis TaxID=2910237 RepID=UPI003D106609
MKKAITISALLLISGSAFAAFNGPEVKSISTVHDALNAKDDSFVVLTGNITQSLGNEVYIFKDSTGEIQVEIEHEAWMGQDISPQDNIVIRGEVDSEWTSTQIDAHSIQKL